MQIKATQLTLFVKKNIVCLFGVPHFIISDNGPQFISKPFQQFCTEYGIKNVYSIGQAEVTNKTLLGYLKKLLTTTNGKWVNELPIELWAYHTTLKQPTGETPYALVFGAEKLIPIESEHETLSTNDTSELSQALDRLEEERDQASIRMTEYHHRAFRQREKIIKPRVFSKGDLSVRRTFKEGKLKPTWEGRFIIVDDGFKGAFRKQSQCDKLEPRPWNSTCLKKYFQ